MKITLTRGEGSLFEVRNDADQQILLEGPAEIGGTGAGLRPMELVLAGLAGCAAIDVLLILQKGRQPIEDLVVHVEGTRADAVPAVFTDVALRFVGTGVDAQKLERAVALSMEKYCSVSTMLRPTVRLTHVIEAG
jgi:putative redox protein